MKKIIMAISLIFLLLGCKGSTNLPINYSIEIVGWGQSGVSLIDRKFESIELDVSQKGYAIFIINMADEIQVDKRIKRVPYTIYFRLQEGKGFSIKK